MTRLTVLLAVSALFAGCGGDAATTKASGSTATTGGAASATKSGADAPSASAPAPAAPAAAIDLGFGGAKLQMKILSSQFNTEVMKGATMTYVYLYNNMEAKYKKDKDQVYFYFALRGKDGTTKAEPKLGGSYPLGKGPDKLEELSFELGLGDGTKQIQFDPAKASGNVEITSATAEEVRGKIDVTEGDNSVKGEFVAKIAR